MSSEQVTRKPKRLRVNFPLAVPLDDAKLIEQAHELLGESRNAFCVAAAIARARDVLRAHRKSANAA